MCGIAGFWSAHPDKPLQPIAAAMGRAIAYRGPDGSGEWCDAANGLALAHRRLAIVDLSAAGHQPMVSDSERLTIVFNGEIYNHLALRALLAGERWAHAWRGHSDTETLLVCFDAWGVERTLQAAVGMFAFALWNRDERTLTLARDRFGEKPLYYGWQGGSFLFASELKAIVAHPDFERQVDRDAVALLLRYNCIPAPWSIWRGIRKLPPASMIVLRGPADTDAVPRPFWSLLDVALAGDADPLALSDQAAGDALEKVLSQAVAGQLMSDVPLGALLSGGVDSTTVVALMQAQSARPVKTFSIGFHEKQFDESVHAAKVAEHLKTDHTTLFMTAEDVLEAVPRMPAMYDEPFADSSQLPTSLVMALARRHVTVALSGDAGDELFGGYNRYVLVPRIWRAMRPLPTGVRPAIAAMMKAIAPSTWDSAGAPLSRLLKQQHLGDKAHKLADRIGSAKSVDDLYLGLLTEWTDTARTVPGSNEAAIFLNQRTRWPNLSDPVARMMAVDSVTYLPDDILVKVDRAAMAASLETRAPFLDHRVAEFAWRLPMHQKIRDGEGKWLLRQVLYRHVPKPLIDRPKMGFGVPINDWLRGPLRDWAEALLARPVLERQGLLNPESIRQVWDLHLSGTRQFGARLWSVLMLQAWLQEQGL
ncbi:asparagine synthase (glutamine-hydrolyzing) [Sphingomonas sp.]|uniref:asparagine synthase (glutamine-hydrolyzing) n=1 Tax=Sphingomonas sp. TaxID=28214 RepID=UPI0025CC77A8|nr:asparagine synthase (glutamine-hydrolyzing) [Sphingomonas sp.]